MNSRNAIIESLESRQFLSASPLHLPAYHAVGGAALTAALKHTGKEPVVTVTDYTGTAVNQDNRGSVVTVVITDTNGVRTGVFNVNNNDGGTTPIRFKIGAARAFAFDFSVGDQEVKATGKISANGQTLTGGWKSIAKHGFKGFGSFTATAD